MAQSGRNKAPKKRVNLHEPNLSVIQAHKKRNILAAAAKNCRHSLGICSEAHRDLATVGVIPVKVRQGSVKPLAWCGRHPKNRTSVSKHRRHASIEWDEETATTVLALTNKQVPPVVNRETDGTSKAAVEGRLIASRVILVNLAGNRISHEKIVRLVEDQSLRTAETVGENGFGAIGRIHVHSVRRQVADVKIASGGEQMNG